MNSSKSITLAVSLLLGCPLCGTNHAADLRATSTAESRDIAGAGGSFTPGFSADGRFVAFVSHARNLVTNDDASPYLNVYVRDLVTSNTILVSVNTNGLGGGNADSTNPSISSNGQFVAFVSTASNLVTNDHNGAADIFVRDLVSGTTTLVTVDNTGLASPIIHYRFGQTNAPFRDRLSGNPIISGDGRWVVFESFSASLVASPDTNGLSDIFARDLQSDATYLVSISTNGTTGNGSSTAPSVSHDGRYVAFVSTSSNLTTDLLNQPGGVVGGPFGDIYVRDLQTGTTHWASTNVARFFFMNRYGSFNPVLSTDGRSLIFKVFPFWDYSDVRLILYNLQSGLNAVLTNHCSPVTLVQTSGSSVGDGVSCNCTYQEAFPSPLTQISADGRFVACESSGNIYVFDLQLGTNVLVSVANKPCYSPAMSSDGARVAFLSAATDLSPDAQTGVSQVFVRDLISQTTHLVSANLEGKASSTEIAVTPPAISADGRFVAFESGAADLALDDWNHDNDVFVRDVDAAQTQLVSRRHADLPARTTPGFSTALPRCISADGRYIAFLSSDGNLAPDDTNGAANVFVRDILIRRTLAPTGPTNALLRWWRPNPLDPEEAPLDAVISANGRFLVVAEGVPSLPFPNVYYAGTTLVRCDLMYGTNQLVNVDSYGVGLGGIFSAPAINSDGNLIAFHSGVSLGSVPTYAQTNVFVRDIAQRRVTLVSMNYQGNAGGNGPSFNPIFSPDDRWVCFLSTAANLTTNGLAGTNLFARDLVSNTTRLISLAPDGSSSLGYSRGATFSADSRHIAYVSALNSVVVHDLFSRANLVVCSAGDNPSLSADGQLVAYETANSGSAKQILVQDLRSGETNLISRNAAGTGGNGDSTSPLLSWDGRFVAFASKASDLVDNDTNKASDIFVCDRALGTMVAVSMNLRGDGTGNGPSTKPVMAADGRTVVFQSLASDLVPGDYNYRRDVFVLRLGGPDTDGDGMDDDWEMAYFGTLARDGTGDFDHDGRTDLQEFQAGTDPTNAGSVLHALTVTSVGGSSTRVIWSASPGKKYQVQFTEALGNSSWQTLPGTAIANGTTGSFVDNSGGQGGRRFYRVVLAQ